MEALLAYWRIVNSRGQAYNSRSACAIPDANHAPPTFIVVRSFPGAPMNIFTDHLTLMIIAAVLSLPMGLLIAFQVSLPRSRFLAMLGGVIGAAVVGFAIYWAVEVTQISLDALTYFLGCVFACSAGVIIGAVLTNFLLDVITGASDASSQEL
jgi:hypothetical protein